jgi:small-conductance mechanosensitive channel
MALTPSLMVLFRAARSLSPIQDTPAPSADSVPPDSAAGAVSAVSESLLEFLQANLGLSGGTLVRIIGSAAVIFLVWLVRRLVLRIAYGRLRDSRARYQWSKASSYMAFFLAAILVAQVWVEGLREVGTFLGLVGAGLAIALKDALANLAGWVFILWRRPFEVGDRIQIGEHAGDVIDIRIFQFSMLEIGNWVDADQSTGRVIHVPNSQVFTVSVANYTAQFEYLWNEIAVLVTFESDWKKAKGILETIAREVAGDLSVEAEGALKRAARRFLIHYRTLTPTVYTGVKDSGVMLTLRYLCKPRTRRSTAQAVWEAILEAFGRERDIDFAYPTQRLYYNQLEGKEGSRAPLPSGWGEGRLPGGGSGHGGPART